MSITGSIISIAGNSENLFLSTDTGSLLVASYSNIKQIKTVKLFNKEFLVHESFFEGVWITRFYYMYYYDTTEKKLTKNSCQVHTENIQVSRDNRFVAINCGRDSNCRRFKVYSVALKFPEVYMDIEDEVGCFRFSQDKRIFWYLFNLLNT